MVGRNEMSRHFLFNRGCRCAKYGTGYTGRPYRHILPIQVSDRTQLAEQIGVRGGGSPALLLSNVSPSVARETIGTGFGVKPMPQSLIGKMDGVSVAKKRKNVNISF
jgi:hypothetical protein